MLTSQRVVDVVLKAFGACAASQGRMAFPVPSAAAVNGTAPCTALLAVAVAVAG